MLYMALTSSVIAVAALIRLFYIKRQMKRMKHQLQAYNQGLTEKKINLDFFERDLEPLASEINNLIDLVTEANVLRRRTQYELKQGISDISHDLRTPLTSILGNIQLLETDNLTEQERKEYLLIAKIRTKRLQTLLNEFFELSVIESADYKLKIERVDLNTLLPEILFGFYDRFNEENREPIFQTKEEKLILITDESAVRRVVENLISNALDHADSNIWISLEKLHATMVLSIRNEARHLTENDINLLFNRFFRADQARSGKGTGLGLSIAKSLMLSMNGTLSAELHEQQLTMRCEWKSD